jgi:hypothetical protein
VSIHVAGTLSGTIKSAQIARDMLPDREIHVVDSLRPSSTCARGAGLAGPRPPSARSCRSSRSSSSSTAWSRPATGSARDRRPGSG